MSLWDYGAALAQWALKHPAQGGDDGTPEPTTDQLAAMRANLVRIGAMGVKV